MPIYLNNYSEFSVKAKLFASKKQPCIILDSCEIKPQLDKGHFKLLIAFGGSVIVNSKKNKLDSLFEHWQKKPSWIFGVIGYNIKNEIEKLDSGNDACFGWPDLQFFEPQIVITIGWDNKLECFGEEHEKIYKEILDVEIDDIGLKDIEVLSQLKLDFDEKAYKNCVESIKEEIVNGNVYELNLCLRFLYDSFYLDNPFGLYEKLIKISPSPFSGFYCIHNQVVISASPERFLNKIGNTLISQPIKGTRKRGTTENEDILLKDELKNSVKDRAENVMIVDLVRNDFAKVAKTGTIKVDELFGIYSYSHVHQMVSTIGAELEENKNGLQLIKASFPMGSMTGAPKIAAMKLIEHFENSNREWYSGAMGYINPEGNMDFNVLIRSIFYDSNLKKLAYYAGGAITFDSEATAEYEEMMLKASAIKELLKV